MGMASVLIQTEATKFAPTNTTNVTTNGFTQPVPTKTAPSGTGIINFGHPDGALASNAIILIPYGVGSDTNTFAMNVYGWRPIPGSLGGTLSDTLWVPMTLATFTGCELNSGMPGLSGAALDGTQYFCSDITLGIGNSGISVEVVSPGHANNQVAHTVIDAKGCRLLEVRFSTGGSATSCNALWAKI